jgi:ABC-type sugar transport system ATPase subunit
MAEVTLRNLSVRFADFAAVDDVSLTVRKGEFVVYLGPSGCGKTTTLRCVAGLERATAGDILFDGQRVNDLSPSQRNIAMVFQFVSLYPHLTVRENILFPLRARGMGAREMAERLDWVTGIFGLSAELPRYTGALPPGVRQKIALARAVIRKPAVLLLDEPLSAIDEQFREDMRWELGHLQRQIGVTTIYVTHDQREAMSLADRIVLMNGGRIVQVAAPSAIWRDPDDTFAAQFIGSPSMNLIPAEPAGAGLRLGGTDQILTSADGLPAWVCGLARPVLLGIRPVHVDLTPAGGLGLPVEDSFSVGRERFFSFRVGDLLCQGTDPGDTRGDRVRFRPEGMLFFDAGSGRRLREEAAA